VPFGNFHCGSSYKPSIGILLLCHALRFVQTICIVIKKNCDFLKVINKCTVRTKPYSHYEILFSKLDVITINRLTAKYTILHIPPTCPPRVQYMQFLHILKNSSVRDHQKLCYNCLSAQAVLYYCMLREACSPAYRSKEL